MDTIQPQELKTPLLDGCLLKAWPISLFYDHDFHKIDVMEIALKNLAVSQPRYPINTHALSALSVSGRMIIKCS